MGSKQDYLFLLAGQYSCRGRFFYWALLCYNLSAADCCFFFLFIYLSMGFCFFPTRPGGKGHLLSELPNWVYTHSPQQHCSCCACARVCMFAHASIVPPPPTPSFASRLWEWREWPRRCAFHIAGCQVDTLAWLSASPVSVVVSVCHQCRCPPHPRPSPSLPTRPINQVCHFLLRRHGQEGRPQADAGVVQAGSREKRPGPLWVGTHDFVSTTWRTRAN